jgi:hypothetical protein
MSQRLPVFGLMILGVFAPQLAAQNCGAYSGVSAWTGSFTLTGSGSGPLAGGSPYSGTVTEQNTLSSTKVVLSSFYGCDWYGVPDSSWSGSTTFNGSLTYVCNPYTFSGSGSGVPSDGSASISIDPSKGTLTFLAFGSVPGTETFNFCGTSGSYPADLPVGLYSFSTAVISVPAVPHEIKGSLSFSAPGIYSQTLNWTLTYDFTPTLVGPPNLSLSPSTAAAGDAAFTLTINGTGFAPGATVQWNGTAIVSSFVSATQLTATVPAPLVATAGTAVVSVVQGGSTIGSALFTVNPPGQSCTFTFSPPSASIGASGGSGTVAVTASRNDCTWTANSTSWITFPNATFTGGATLNYTVVPNNAGTSRTGTINVGAQSFTVTQGGTVCTYSLPQSVQPFGAGGGSGSGNVQAPPGCAWSVSSDSSWVIATPPGASSGDGTFSYTVTANSGAARAATLTVAGQSYIVSEAAGGSNVSCTASAASAPVLALEGRTELLGDMAVNCTGVTSAVKTDILLALNTNVTSTDAVLTVNGGASQPGVVAGPNELRWAGVSLVAGGNGMAAVRISNVRADASILAVPGSAQPVPVTGRVSLISPTPLSLTADTQTLGTAARTLAFSRLQPNIGSAQATVGVMFTETSAQAFKGQTTRLRVRLTNVPANIQVYAPIFPAEGTTKAQLYSTDLNGAGGAPVAGTSFMGGLYQQLTLVSGAASATWVVLAADPAAIDTYTFPLLLLNASTADLNTMQVSGSLAPVSDVSLAIPSAPVPRYRDLSTPQKLTNLRVSTTVKSSQQSSSTARFLARAVVGSNLSFVTQIINDTSDAAQAATNVTVRDNVPSGVTVSGCTASGGTTCSVSNNQVTVNYGSIAPGQTVSVTVNATVDASIGNNSVFENAVSAASDQVNADLLASISSASFIFLPSQGTPPVVVGVTPAYGSGNSQDFTFKFAVSTGYQNLGVVNILINSALDARRACYLAYVVPSSTLVLVNDNGDAGGPYAGSLTAPGTSIENGQCAVRLTDTPSGSGTTLTLPLNITFKPSFGGNRIMYVAARDQGSGNSNWQPLGQWQVPFAQGNIGIAAVNPRWSAPAGQDQAIQIAFTAKGTADFGVVNVLVNSALDARQACYLAYIAASNTLVLVNDNGDAGGPYAGALVLNGSPGTIQNTQCQINGAASLAALGSGTLTLTLDMTFRSSFAGNRVVYVAGRDKSDGNNTGWQAVGTWTVQ